VSQSNNHLRITSIFELQILTHPQPHSLYSPSCAACGPLQYSAAGSTTCTTCPTGSYPDATKSTCLLGIFTCGDGLTPSSVGSTTCIPLVCTAPLVLPPATPRTSCLGCSYGKAGSPSTSCTACSGTGICPGGTSVSLVSSLSLPPAVVAACPPLTSNAAPSSYATPPSLGSDLAQSIGGAILGFILFVTIVGTLARAYAPVLTASTIDGLGEKAKPIMKLIDKFSSSHPVKEGGVAVKKSTVLGGSLTFVSIGVLAVLAAVLAQIRSESNTLVLNSLDVFSNTAVTSTKNWKWKEANINGDTKAVSGVVVRITAAGEPGACAAPLEGPVSTGLSSGSWSVIAATASCGSAGGAVSQFTLGCTDCIFTPQSTLSLSMHYSCQSLLIEAGAVDSSGVLLTASILPSLLVPPSGSLLSSVSWTVAPLYSMLNDTASGQTASIDTAVGLSARGYGLISSASAVTMTPLVNSTGGGVFIAPISSSIYINVALPLKDFILSTKLTQKQTVLQLLSSIAGFQGVVFSIFGIIFGFLIARSDESHDAVKKESSDLQEASIAPDKSVTNPETDVTLRVVSL
jgi:hypothetical protein